MDHSDCDLLLIGGGHAHALVLRRWADGRPPPGRIILVDPQARAPYTGMLPGHIAGHYERADLDIDLTALTASARAEFVQSRIVALDPDANTARLEHGGTLGFRVASLDIGITSAAPNLDVTPAKPLGAFAEAWSDYLDRVSAGAAAPRIAVIGGGVGGIELVLAMAFRLRRLVAGRIDATLIEAADTILPGGPATLRRALAKALRRHSIRVLTGKPVSSYGMDQILLADKTDIAADFAVAAAGAQPAGWLGGTGLSLENGFIRVGPDLSAENHSHIFAAGDIAHMTHDPREKAGVFAVRQAPVLAENLAAALKNEARQDFDPQQDYLKLISLGGKSAIASKWGVAAQAPGLWSWKNRIDRAFMDHVNSNAPAPKTA